MALIKMSLKFLVGLKEVIITVKQALVAMADEAYCSFLSSKV